MHMARILPWLILALLLPILSLVLILLTRRSRTIPNLSLALTLSGLTGAVFTVFFTYSSSTPPFAPYPLSRGSWFPIIRLLLLSLYVGFGLGSFFAALVVTPIWLIRKLNKKGPSTIEDPDSSGEI
jgi:hypothetical protein